MDAEGLAALVADMSPGARVGAVAAWLACPVAERMCGPRSFGLKPSALCDAVTWWEWWGAWELVGQWRRRELADVEAVVLVIVEGKEAA